MTMPQLRITKQITRRDNHSIEKYLHMVQAIKLLTVDEEISLTKTIKKGFASQEKVKEAKEVLQAVKKKIIAAQRAETEQPSSAEKAIPHTEQFLKVKEALESTKKKIIAVQKVIAKELPKAEKTLESTKKKIIAVQKVIAEQKTDAEQLPKVEKALESTKKKIVAAQKAIAEQKVDAKKTPHAEELLKVEKALESAKKKIVATQKAIAEQKVDAEKTPHAEELLKAEKALESAKKKSEKAVLEASHAREKLVNGNLRFVISVAKQYQNRGLSISDLINEGNIGLIKAAERFDETRGFKFISYAVWWIRQSILQATQETARMIRIPLNKMSVIQKIYKEAKRLKKILERNPTESEIGEELGMTAQEVASVLEMNMKPLSINAPFKEGEENTLLDVLEDEQAIQPENNLMDESMRENLVRAINTLDEREQKVIKEHFCIPEKGKTKKFSKTLEDIANEMGLTRERVRQIREQSIKKIREFLMKKESRNSYRSMRNRFSPNSAYLIK